MASTIHYSKYHSGFGTMQDLLIHMTNELTSNGYFRRVFPASHQEVDGEGVIVLEPTHLVDGFRGVNEEVDTWRIAFTPTPSSANGGRLTLNVATNLQIRDDGTIAHLTGDWEAAVTPGHIRDWIDRSKLQGNNAWDAYPMTYALTISDHGIFLGVWDQAFDEFQDEYNNISPSFRWIVIQRPVDNKTGDPYLGGRAPVFCAYTLISSGMTLAGPEWIPFGPIGTTTGGGSGSPASANPTVNLTIPRPWTPNLTQEQTFYMLGSIGASQIQQGDFTHFLRPTEAAQFHFKFVVCEEDVNRPTLARPADSAMPDSNPILNSQQLVAVSEDNKYVITIPKGLNTPRFAYTHELDLIAYTSADVIGQGTEVDLPLYEGMYRYKALPANRLKNTGMRLLYRIADPEPEEPEETTTIEPETTTTNEPDPEG